MRVLDGRTWPPQAEALTATDRLLRKENETLTTARSTQFRVRRPNWNQRPQLRILLCARDNRRQPETGILLALGILPGIPSDSQDVAVGCE